ncbi:MAG: DUF4372 domain-containing protein [Haliscomenobacter sp.]|nr:DUF4372 domain-containing protein [Haliscomenobacter sp.]
MGHRACFIKGDYRARTLKCWQQFLGLSFGQPTHRESLRDLVSCLEAPQYKLYPFDNSGQSGPFEMV